jgi:hypothetical protein
LGSRHGLVFHSFRAHHQPLSEVTSLWEGTGMSTPHLRAARTDEAALLSDLALRPKGYWGYDHAFLDACRAELTLAPEDVKAQRVTVAERDGRVVGFYALAGAPPEGTLEDLFVEALGFARITLEADPGAEPFYLAMGGRRCGSVPSGSIPDRRLPLLEFSIASALKC